MRFFVFYTFWKHVTFLRMEKSPIPVALRNLIDLKLVKLDGCLTDLCEVVVLSGAADTRKQGEPWYRRLSLISSVDISVGIYFKISIVGVSVPYFYVGPSIISSNGVKLFEVCTVKEQLELEAGIGV